MIYIMPHPVTPLLWTFHFHLHLDWNQHCNRIPPHVVIMFLLLEEFLGTEGTPVPPYKTAIEEDVSILGNNRFSPLQFESCSVANDDEINDEPHTMVECNNKATSQLLMLRLCQSLEVIGKRLLHYLVTPFSQ
jgi:hypothetical protein